MKTFTPILCASMCLLTACGGGGTGENLTPTIPTNTAAVISALKLSGAGATAQTSTEVVSISGTSLDVGTTVNMNAQTATIGSSALTTGLSNVGALSAVGNNLADVQLVAIQTSASDMPTGRLSYSGKALVVLNDGSDTYEVLMDATMDADLRSNSGTVGITATGVNSAIQPQVTAANGVTTNYAASGSEQITLTGATVSGVGISGGTDATATGWNGNASNVIIGNVNADTSGVFAGAQAAEIAGTSVVTGSGGGWFNMTFAGKQ